MGQSRKPIANPSAVLREEFEDWAVLFTPDAADAVGVNPVGVAIWKLMDGKRSLEDIASAVSEHFSEVPDAVDAQVESFVDKLANRGLVSYRLETNGQ